MSVTLSPQIEERIRQKIEIRSYRDVDEVIDEALRLLDA
jgi:Arc/MetJ-type ribon-helix-helix transcriptional regulator